MIKKNDSLPKKMIYILKIVQGYKIKIYVNFNTLVQNQYFNPDKFHDNY